MDEQAALTRAVFLCGLWLLLALVVDFPALVPVLGEVLMTFEEWWQETGGYAFGDLNKQAARTTWETAQLELHQESQYYKNKAAQRGARMQILRDWMRKRDWDELVLSHHPEAREWFDEDGVPK